MQGVNLCCDDVFLKVALSKCLYMRGLFHVKFCMLSSHLWIIIRPKEYLECSP